MDYITKLSKETDASIHTYILLDLINHMAFYLMRENFW